MGNSFTTYSFLAFLGCLLIGMAFAWLSYDKPGNIQRVLRIILAAIRTFSVTLILWLLFSPPIKKVSYTLEKPIVVIAQDNSQSAGHILPADFDSLRYRKDLQELSNSLAAQYELKLFSFSDTVSKGLDFGYKGKVTNAMALAAKLRDELMNRNVGAIILATDGIFNRGGNPSLIFETLSAPVYTIALGDSVPKKDLQISNVSSNDLVYLENNFQMQISVEAYQCNGEQAQLRVLEDGKKVHEEVIPLKGDLVTKTISISLKAAKLGRHQYTVILGGLSGELSLKNNQQQIAVEVIDDRIKVLIASAAPHPDIATIKQAISRNKQYEVVVVTNKDLAGTDPTKYGLIILYQLPALQFNDNGFIQKVAAVKIPVWYIVGAQSHIDNFNEVQKLVKYKQFSENGLQYIYSKLNTGFSAFELDSVSGKVISDFDPLQAPLGTWQLSGMGQVIFNQRNGKVKTTQPQLFFMNDNGRKTGFLIGEGIYKWKLASYAAGNASGVFDVLIAKVIQFLSVNVDKKKFRVSSSKNTFDEDEHIQLNATLYNDSYQSVKKPDVSITLKDQEGKKYSFLFSKSQSSYQLDAGVLPAGSYSYLANTTLGGQRHVAQGSFLVNNQIAEFQQSIANHQLLHQLSARTDAKSYSPDQLLALKTELVAKGKMKTLSYEDRTYEELIHLKWLCALILLLLSTEWFFRKINALP